MQRANPKKRSGPRQTGDMPSAYLRAVLIRALELYVSHRATEAARRLGVSRRAVGYWARAAGLSSRKAGVGRQQPPRQGPQSGHSSEGTTRRWRFSTPSTAKEVLALTRLL